MEKRIAVLPGDGVGPEVTAEAVKVMQVIAARFNHHFIFEYGLVGASAIDATGDPFPVETKLLCKNADAVLFGAIGDPKYDNNPAAKVRPEQGLLAMRKELGLFANVRPVKCYDALLNKTPLKPEIAKGTDLVVYRELTGGIYFGDKGRTNDGMNAFDICEYSKPEIIRVAKLAFEAAGKRSKKLTVVDKANVLETSRLWRETVQDLAGFYPEITVDYMFVDNAAMQLVLNPRNFDVVLTENMFGDILTDEASVIAGSLGLLPSASVGDKYALFEPIHGSYPQAASKGIANPIGSILSAAMMLEIRFEMTVEAAYIYKAVSDVISQGYLTQELMSKNPCSTNEVGDRIAAFILEENPEMV